MLSQTQLIHYDGSASDTIIEVNVRHPGKMDRNIVSMLVFISFNIFIWYIIILAKLIHMRSIFKNSLY